MKKLLYISVLLLIGLTSFTSCEAEELNENEQTELATEPGDDGAIEETDPDDDGEG